MSRDREYFNRIKTMGFEKATAWMIEEMSGTIKQHEEALRMCAEQITQMADIMGHVVTMGEQMKKSTEEINKLLGKGIPEDAPTPGDDRLQ